LNEENSEKIKSTSNVEKEKKFMDTLGEKK